MDRKGDLSWRIIFEITFGLLIFVGVLYLINIAGFKPFGETLTCDTTDPQYACKPVSEGCGESYSRVLYKIRGCEAEGGKGQVCCITDADATGSPSDQEKQASVRLSLSEATTKGTGNTLEIVSEEGLPNGKTLDAIVGVPKSFVFNPEVENCSPQCTPTNSISVRTMTDDIVYDSTTQENQIGAEKKTNDGKEIITFTFPQKFSGERVQVLAKSSVGANKAEDDTIFFLNVKAAVQCGGLTSQWERSKTVSCECRNGVDCSELYFQIIPEQQPNTELKCPEPEVTAATLMPIKYCVIDETGNAIRACHDKETECWKELSTIVTPESAATQRILEEAQTRGMIPEIVLPFLQGSEKEAKRYTCAKTLSNDLIEGKIYKAEKPNLNIDRWTFTLDKPFMTNKNVCIWGQSTFDEQKQYPYGDPVPIRIDRIPPQGEILFSPGTLQLTFICEDAHSECEDYVGLTYIDDLTNFFGALTQGGVNSASLWCPPATTGPYRAETRDQVAYTDQSVRVLCMRVTDRAGNHGLAIKTVYNLYDTLANLLVIAFQDKEKQQFVPTGQSAYNQVFGQ